MNFEQRWAKAAVVYFVIGVGIGMYMSLARNHIFPGFHAHVNLLGWVSMALIASFYRIFPSLSEHKLSDALFWMYQIAFPTMMAGLFLSPIGYGEIAGPLVGLGGIFVGVAVLLFAIAVFTTETGRRAAVSATRGHRPPHRR